MAAELAERVYTEIKRSILSGALRQRERLDITRLAEATRASATPVRQALAILAHEGLVRLEGTRGYHVAFWSEAELRGLYQWRAMLALLAAQTYAPGPPPFAPRHDLEETARIFLQHLASTANGELRRASQSADERLAAARRVEADVLGDVAGELDALAEALRAGAQPLRQRLKSYFRRRIARADRIRQRAGVAALPRNGG